MKRYLITMTDKNGNTHALDVRAINETKARKFAIVDIANLTYEDPANFQIVSCTRL